ncbi:DUF2017 family protein [Pseudactinotalea sp. HY160]|uniref:DUF2017 family protein n=1 Tax=Pseudactinotalea sp. HY160 TaxID=2654490 RepID=UPI00128C95D0|nr:DUF2017 family protein [Pseudactinotalea sp. HY160]MPV50207.1 DUF2017 family protein [Pseudactinotalea sp. HY160]
MSLFSYRNGACVASIDATTREFLRLRCIDMAVTLGGRIATADSLAEPVEPSIAHPDPRVQVVGWSAEDLEAPTNEAAARLLPPARVTDDEVAAEFRRLTEHDLREAKLGQLQLVHDSLDEGDEVRLSMAEALDWTAGVNTMRLILATWMRIDSPERADEVAHLARQSAPDRLGDQNAYFRHLFAHVYTILGALQESVLEALLDHAEG